MLHFDPYSPTVDADPFPYYKRLRDEAPCFRSEEAQMWVLSRYADIVSAGQDWRTYSSASGNMMTELPNRAGATLGTTDPPRHDRLRALVQYAFIKRNLEGLAEPIRAIAKGAAEDLRGARPFDFKDYSAKFTVRVLMAALGLPSGDEAIVDEETVREKAVLMVQSDPRTRAKGPEHLAAFEWMRDYAAKVIAVRRAAPRNDLISNFASAEIDDDDADHGGGRIARRLHDDVRLQSRELARSARSGGQESCIARGRHRGEPALQHLGSALPPPPDEGRRTARAEHERGRLRVPGLWFGQPRRAAVSRSRPLRRRPQAPGASWLRRRRPRVPRRLNRTHRDQDRL